MTNITNNTADTAHFANHFASRHKSQNSREKPVLAKDRHYIYRLSKDIKQLTGDEKIKKQAKLDELIMRSNKAVQARSDSIPKDLANLLNHDLPVSSQAELIIKAICEHQVVIVAGETGSGKTTQLPKLAMLAGRGRTGQIGHTQPRRLAARSVATRIAEELNEPLGRTVSFKVRFTEEGGSHSLVKLMTDGILLAELGSDRFLSRYDTIIIDEAHERSLNIDFILGYLKRILPKRPDLRVIITSATLDTQRFADYFAREGKPVPIINVEGRSYPVEVRYRPLTEQIVRSHDDDAFDEMEDSLPRALTSAVAECFDDARQKGQPDKADILIFASTEAEIRELQDILTTHAPPHTEVLPLFARQSYAEQQRIFAPSGRGRRIIIATNVAETALTVPNIYYVIDLGFARISRYNYRSRIQRLPIEAISQASANQRKGRCGRIGNGVCIRLYSEEDFLSRAEFTEPEILRTNLASVILQMEHLKLGDVANFEFITEPDFRLINDGKKLLHELGAISEKPTKTALKKQRNQPSSLTHIGKQMAKMPIDPRLARMLIAGNEFACLADMLIIVSALAVQDVRERPINKQAQADQKHALFRKEHSDFLFYVELFRVLFASHEMHEGEKFTDNKLSGNARKNFAKKHYLSFPRIKEWQKTHSQLSQMVAELGFSIDNDFGVDGSGMLDDDVNQSPKNTTSKGRIGLKNKQNTADTKSVKHLKTSSKPQKHSTQKPTASDPKAVHYANLHRALLTALLSFVAHKTDTLGEYMMARSQKARIFPASTLHKKGVEWLLAFEVVETSKVYMRTLAKIEPEWVLACAGELLKYHYFEPHWSKKTGRVRAYAQISLFGLIIVHKQVVNFEQIDVTACREIFIRDGLVANQYPKNLPFLTHNNDKINEAMLMEDKLRRRDLLADEERLYQFYNDKIPPHIASAKAFEDWLGELKDDRLLYFSDEDVLNENTTIGKEFPEFWQMGTLKLPLSYVFDPSSDDDGVSVRVPIGALPQLDSVDLLWGVAGWRYELVLQLLKSLPKEIRRQIVPIPDTADKIFDGLDKGGKFGLLDQLCHALKAFGVNALPSHFQVAQIDKYLQPLICVLDDKKRLIDKGRDLAKLQAKHQSTTVKAVQSEGVHDSFPTHFDFVKNKHLAGVVMQEFSALASDGTTKVSIHKFTDLPTAIATHKAGILTLIKSELGAKQKQLSGQIDKAFKLAFAPLGDLEKLKTLLIDATLQVTLDTHGTDFGTTKSRANHERDLVLGLINTEKTAVQLDKLPLTTLEFEHTKTAVLAQFLTVGQTVLKTLKDIYTTWQTVRGQLLMLDREVFGESIDDIEDQLDDLALADFVYRVNYEQWRHYPRYLEALKVRLERLPNNLDNDLDAVYLLDEHMERLANRVHDPRFAEYRWLVEEYRINLFAQPMKTLSAVSAKRLDKIWMQITTS